MPVSEPGPGEVLLRVLAVGLCGSDAHWFREGGIGDATLGEGLVLGHEFCAVIESGPRQGERVAVDPAIPCLTCEQCLAGRHNLCIRLTFAGHGIDGALRRHMVWPERCLVSVSDDLPDEQAAMLEPLGVALHAIDLAGGVEGAAVGMVGCGPIGLLLIGALRQQGASTISAVEPLTHRLETAGEMGASETASTTLDNPGFDVVFETAGTDDALHSALEMARPGGRVVLVGIPDRDRTSFIASLARRKELALLACRRMLPGDLARAAALAAILPGLDRLVTHRYPLAEADRAFQTLVERSGLKVVVTP
jgi:L-iditol 2-dehydrogenase